MRLKRRKAPGTIGGIRETDVRRPPKLRLTGVTVGGSEELGGKAGHSPLYEPSAIEVPHRSTSLPARNRDSWRGVGSWPNPTTKRRRQPWSQS